jgi:hypothetical protein
MAQRQKSVDGYGRRCRPDESAKVLKVERVGLKRVPVAAGQEGIEYIATRKPRS